MRGIIVAIRGGVSDSSQRVVDQTLSIECPFSIFFWPVVCVSALSFCCFLFMFSYSRRSFVDIPLIVLCPTYHVPD